MIRIIKNTNYITSFKYNTYNIDRNINILSNKY